MTDFFTTFIEYFQYPFFVRALVVGVSISLLLSFMSGYVVLRREVLFTDALSNMAFLGIAIAILFNLPITISLLTSCLLAAYFINVVRRKNLFSSDSILEIFAQLGLAFSVVVISFFPGYRVNLEQFLFGDILAISQADTVTTIVLILMIGAVVIARHKIFLTISLSDLLSQTIVKNKGFYHVLLVALLALTIGLAMKIVGVLLVAAFTTIPANIAKVWAKSLKQTFALSVFFGVISTVLGLYISAFSNIPSGASIVVCLVSFWIISILFANKAPRKI